MSADEEFAKRISDIHRLGLIEGGRVEVSQTDLDIRHAEFEAMVISYLGEDYDKARLIEVEKRQVAFERKQSEYGVRLEKKRISAAEYVDLFNDLARRTFSECEEILGVEDFEKLFGAKLSELNVLINKDDFLRLHVDSK